MNEEQQRIWEYLNQNAVGYDNRKSSSEIKDALDLESGGPTNEHIRDLEKKTLERAKYIVVTEKNKELALRDLRFVGQHNIAQLSFVSDIITRRPR